MVGWCSVTYLVDWTFRRNFHCEGVCSMFGWQLVSRSMTEQIEKLRFFSTWRPHLSWSMLPPKSAIFHHEDTTFVDRCCPQISHLPSLINTLSRFLHHPFVLPYGLLGILKRWRLKKWTWMLSWCTWRKGQGKTLDVLSLRKLFLHYNWFFLSFFDNKEQSDNSRMHKQLSLNKNLSRNK